MKKLIELEFEDNFIAPKEVDRDTPYMNNKCRQCPLFVWNCNIEEGTCVLIQDFSDSCPISKYFD